MEKIKHILFACFLGLSISACSQNQFEKVSLGEYPIGFKSLTVYDTLRPVVKEQPQKDKGRVLQLNIWYPAVKNQETRMNFNDYVNLISKEIDLNKENKESASNTFYNWTFQNKTASSQLIDFKKNGISMNAYSNAKHHQEKFPVVLLIHGGAADFAFMGEFLASYGYVVLNVPYKGFLQAELDVNLLGMETEVADFEFALQFLKGKFLIDTDNISVVGASFGGQSALSFSLRNKVKSIVSLDGGIGSSFGARLLQSDKAYAIENINSPLLHLYNPNDIYTDLTYIDDYKYSNRKLIGMKNMDHVHFWSWGILDRYVPNVIGDIRPGNSYEAVLQETLNFIERHSKNKESSCDWCDEFQDSVENLEIGQ